MFEGRRADGDCALVHGPERPASFTLHPLPTTHPKASLFSNLQVIMIASQFLPILIHLLFYFDKNLDNIYTFNRAAL